MTTIKRKKGFIIILSSPSAAGKSTLVSGLLKIDNNIRKSISVTTRNPRLNEVDGKDYYFKTTAEFKELIIKNKLLEHANIYGNNYGTPTRVVEEFLTQGIDVLFDIDYQGMNAIKTLIPNIVTIFVLPPSLSILEKRIKERGQDQKEAIKLRMKLAVKEIEHARYYDYVIVNDDFNDTLKKIHSIINAERLKKNRLEVDNFLSELKAF